MASATLEQIVDALEVLYAGEFSRPECMMHAITAIHQQLDPLNPSEIRLIRGRAEREAFSFVTAKTKIADIDQYFASHNANYRFVDRRMHRQYNPEVIAWDELRVLAEDIVIEAELIDNMAVRNFLAMFNELLTNGLTRAEAFQTLGEVPGETKTKGIGIFRMSEDFDPKYNKSRLDYATARARRQAMDARVPTLGLHRSKRPDLPALPTETPEQLAQIEELVNGTWVPAPTAEPEELTI